MPPLPVSATSGNRSYKDQELKPSDHIFFEVILIYTLVTLRSKWEVTP